METKQIVQLLKSGKIGVIPTDTIYGVVGSALNPQSVKEIYTLRKRATDKPMIILISSLDDLGKFDIKLNQMQSKFLKRCWPNPLSVILPCVSDQFKYLHRGTNSLAFRIPKDEWFLQLLKQVGPLVAPSANFEGEEPSENIDQAKKYFGGNVDFYVDRGRINSLPSTLIELEKDGSYKMLREGGFKP